MSEDYETLKRAIHIMLETVELMEQELEEIREQIKDLKTNQERRRKGIPEPPPFR